jgi:hypothetical protein
MRCCECLDAVMPMENPPFTDLKAMKKPPFI